MEIVILNPPPPQRTVTLSMTELEAKQLMAVCNAASVESVAKLNHNQSFVTPPIASVAARFWHVFDSVGIKGWIS